MDEESTGASEPPLIALRARLGAYALEAGARQVLVLDAAGFVLCAAAGPGEESEPVALGALAAGTFQAARELAALFGEDECRAFYQQGERTGIYTLLISDRWFFITAFDRVAHVGLIQMLAGLAAHDLAAILARLDAGDAAVRDLVASDAFRAGVDDALDRLLPAAAHLAADLPAAKGGS